MPEPIIVPHPRTREPMSMNQLSRATGLHVTTLTRRYRNGLRGEDLIAPCVGAQKAASEGKRRAIKRREREQEQRRELGWRWYSRQFDRKAKVVMAPTLGDVGQQWSKSLREIMGV